MLKALALAMYQEFCWLFLLYVGVSKLNDGEWFSITKKTLFAYVCEGRGNPPPYLTITGLVYRYTHAVIVFKC